MLTYLESDQFNSTPQDHFLPCCIISITVANDVFPSNSLLGQQSCSGRGDLKKKKLLTSRKVFLLRVIGGLSLYITDAIGKC